MKNKVQIDLAKKTAECLKLRLDEADYRGFSHVADFAENAPTGDGILACSDSFVSVSADCLCRENTAKDRKPISASIARAVMNGELTVEGMIKEYLAKAKADTCNAYITVTEDVAFAAALDVDRRVSQGEYLPLAGVPFSVKDNICTAGIRTTCASRALADFVPDYDATVYERLISAGAVPVGKVNLDEFAVGSDGGTSYFGKCRNPFDLEKTPGGSSSGSAASVAAGSAVFSLGSDTGGSARIPASYCGIAALKPTYGALSRYGLVGMAPSLEQICPMAKSISDLRAVFEAVAGYDCRDMTTFVSYETRETMGRIGVFLPDCATWSAKKAVNAAVKVLEDTGYTTHDVLLPYYECILGIYYTISSAEAASNLARYDGLRYGYASNSGDVADSRSDSFGSRLRERLAEGAYVLTCKDGGAYAEALELREKIKSEFEELFEHYDVIITPMALTEATGFDVEVCTAEKFAVYANLTGAPALTLPAAAGETGLPIGVQLIGRCGDDARLLDIAEKLEEGIEW